MELRRAKPNCLERHKRLSLDVSFLSLQINGAADCKEGGLGISGSNSDSVVGFDAIVVVVRSIGGGADNKQIGQSDGLNWLRSETPVYASFADPDSRVTYLSVCKRNTRREGNRGVDLRLGQ